MKIWLILNLCFFFPVAQEENPFEKQIEGGYCVMSMHDQTVIDGYQQNYTQSVASISKIMSAIIAIEEADISQSVVVNDSIVGAEGSMLYLKQGDVYTLKDLLYGLILRSGNDAALMIANTVSGSEKAFAEKMNAKAKVLGMKNSVFYNASGLDEYHGNISSSCDMALLMSYAMKNNTFRKIVASKGYSPRSGIYWKNKNKFLTQYEGATGGKTGFTKLARRTLVTTSQKGDMEVVVVTLNAIDDFDLHAILHDSAYENYEEVQLVKKGVYHMKEGKIEVKEPITRTIHKGKKDNLTYKATQQKDQIIITSTYQKKKHQEVIEINHE